MTGPRGPLGVCRSRHPDADGEGHTDHSDLLEAAQALWRLDPASKEPVPVLADLLTDMSAGLGFNK